MVEVCLVQILEVCVCLAVYRLQSLPTLFVLKCAKPFKAYWDSFLLKVYCNLQLIPIVCYSKITVILPLEFVIKMSNKKETNNQKEVQNIFLVQ